MAGVDGGHDWLLGDEQGLHRGRRAVVAAQPDQRSVELARGQGRQQGVGLALDQPQLDPRVLAVERAEQAEEPPVRQGLDEAERQAPGEQAAERRHRLAGVPGAGQHRPGMRQERLAGRGQPRCAPTADEQLLAELGFQAGDLLADGRLGDRDPPRRPREVALLGDREEVAQLPEFHKHSYGNQTELVLDVSSADPYRGIQQAANRWPSAEPPRR
jgi:hypothetical protein